MQALPPTATYRLAALAALMVLCSSRPARAQQYGPWELLGPFDYPAGSKDIGVKLPPESEFSMATIAKTGPDPKASFNLPGNRKLAWRPLAPAAPADKLDSGEIDLELALGLDGAKDRRGHSAVFLHRRIDVAQPLELPILVGSSGAVRVWLDGRPILTREGYRHYRFRQDALRLRLAKGSHHLLVKHAIGDEWTWQLRIGEFQGPSPAEIDACVRRGVASLLDQQLPDGSWGGHADHAGGSSAFVLYALLHSGVDPGHISARLALEDLRRRGICSVYGASSAVLALAELEGGSSDPLFAEALAYVQDNQRENGLWDYGDADQGWSRPADLSCTMFASMALRAAALAGKSPSLASLAKLGKGLLELQEETGLGSARKQGTAQPAGFRYELANKEAYGSVTLGGLTALGVVRSLSRGALDKALAQRLEASQASALQWIELNQRWDANPMHENPNAHFFFHLWGVERVGALLDRKELGGADWYAMGAGALLDRQREDGTFFQYYAGEELLGTTLALLFLSRATLPRTGEARLEDFGHTQDSRGDFEIRASGNGPVKIALGSLRGELLAKLGARKLALREVEFRAARFTRERAWKTIARLPAAGLGADELAGLSVEPSFDQAGPWWIAARLHIEEDESVAPEARLPALLRSGTLLVFAQDPNPDERIAEVRLDERRLLPAEGSTVETSSAAKEREGARAVDGRYETEWLCTEEDDSPWIRIVLAQDTRIDRIQLAQAAAQAGRVDEPAVSRIAILLNGRLAQETDLRLDPARKTVCKLSRPETVKSVEIRILERRPGPDRRRAAGFSEIGLLRED